MSKISISELDKMVQSKILREKEVVPSQSPRFWRWRYIDGNLFAVLDLEQDGDKTMAEIVFEKP
jgi:hypothetical protein